MKKINFKNIILSACCVLGLQFLNAQILVDEVAPGAGYVEIFNAYNGSVDISGMTISIGGSVVGTVPAGTCLASDAVFSVSIAGLPQSGTISLADTCPATTDFTGSYSIAIPNQSAQLAVVTSSAAVGDWVYLPFTNPGGSLIGNTATVFCGCDFATTTADPITANADCTAYLPITCPCGTSPQYATASAGPFSAPIPSYVAGQTVYTKCVCDGDVTVMNMVNSASPSCGACPTLVAPLALTVVQSTCMTGCTVSGGSFTEPANICPSGSSVEYSTNGGVTWSGTLPSYMDLTAMTVDSRCVCDSDMSMMGPESTVTTIPGTCPTVAAPAGITITNSTCMGGTVSGGSFNGLTAACTSSTLTYYTNAAGTMGANTTTPTYNQTGPIQTLYTRCVDANGCESPVLTVGPTAPGACACPTLVAPLALTVVESSCMAGCMVSGGSFAEPANICPSGSSVEYSTNGGVTWSGTLPSYMDLTAMTVDSRCVCDSDMSMIGPESTVTTIPGTCPTIAAPAGITITNSTCMGGTVSGGSFNGLAAACTSGTLTYYTDAAGTMGANTTTPTYNQTGPVQTLYTRCVDGNGCESPVTTVGPTVPGTCPGGATFECPATNVVVVTACTEPCQLYTMDITFNHPDPAAVANQMYYVFQNGEVVGGPFAYNGGNPQNTGVFSHSTFLGDGTAGVSIAIGNIIINEVLADPSGSVDHNGDGTASTGEDEFVEIVNYTCEAVDISDWYLDGVDFTFPAGTTLAAGQAAVVFTGGNVANFNVPGNPLLFSANTTFRISNSGEDHNLITPCGVTVNTLDDNGSPSNESITRDPDVTGLALSNHLDISPLEASPGTFIDGTSPFVYTTACDGTCSFDEPTCMPPMTITGTPESLCPSDTETEITAWKLLVDALDVDMVGIVNVSIVYTSVTGQTTAPITGTELDGAHSGTGCADEIENTYAYIVCEFLDCTGAVESTEVTEIGSIAMTYHAPAQAPTIVRDNTTCTYSYTPACTGDAFSPTTVTGSPATPGTDPSSYSVTVTTTNGCTAMFVVDPEACPAPVCPDLSAAAPVAIVSSQSTCQMVCNLTGGVIAAPATACPANSTLQYSIDAGVSWNGTLPIYDQDASVTVLTRCNCDADNTISSPTAMVSTVPGSCTDPADPANVMITNSTCTAGTVSGGSFDGFGTACATGVLTFYTDAAGTMGATTTAPTYNQTGPAQTLYMRCVDATTGCESEPITVGPTEPGSCTCPVGLATSTAPPVVITSESTCATYGGDAGEDGGGVLALPATNCAAGSTLEYSIDAGVTWVAVLPIYNQTTSETILTRCICTMDPSIVSMNGTMTTTPGACPPCPDISGVTAASLEVNITESMCTLAGGTPTGGEIVAPAPDPCPAGSAIEYSSDGGLTWSGMIPTYDQSNPITVMSRCACTADNSIVSAVASVETVPGECPTCAPLVIMATPSCPGVGGVFDIDITSIVGGVSATGGDFTVTDGTTTITYPATTSITGITYVDQNTKVTLTITDADNPACTTTYDVLQLNCAEQEVCDCDAGSPTSAADYMPLTINAQGAGNGNGFSMFYVLVDMAGNVVAVNATGTFAGLADKDYTAAGCPPVNYTVHAVNIKDGELAAGIASVTIGSAFSAAALEAAFCADASCNAIFNPDCACPKPSIAVDKDDADDTDDNQVVIIGNDATFTITIENDGNETLCDIVITDPNGPNCVLTAAEITALVMAQGDMDAFFDPGESITYTCTVPMTALGDFTNTVMVSATGCNEDGTPGSGFEVDDEDPSEVDVIPCPPIIVMATPLCDGIGSTFDIMITAVSGGDPTTANYTFNDGTNNFAVDGAALPVTLTGFTYTGQNDKITFIVTDDDNPVNCTIQYEVLQLNCVAQTVCDCDDFPDTMPLTINAQASGNGNGFSMFYVLVDLASGTVTAVNQTGTFTPLADKDYNDPLCPKLGYEVHAINVKDDELAAAEASVVIGSPFDPVALETNFCADAACNAMFMQDCECTVCPGIAMISSPDPDVCFGETVDISISGLTDFSKTANGVRDYGLTLVQFPGAIAPADPYSGGTIYTAWDPIPDDPSMVECIALPVGEYTFCVILDDVSAPTEASCRPSQCINITIFEIPTVSPTADAFCAGETTTLTGNASGGATPYTHSWTLVDDGGSGVVLANATSANAQLDASAVTGSAALNGPITITVSYSVEDANGCSAQDEFELQLNVPYCGGTPDYGGTDPTEGQ